MKKRFLLFPIIALLATGCSGSGYDTSAKLPAGGKKISDAEEQAEVTADVFSSIGKFFSKDAEVLATLPDITGLTANASLDVHVKYNSSYSDENGYVSRSSVKADTTGKFSVGYYINNEAPDPEATFNLTSAAKIEIEDFNYKMDYVTYEKIFVNEEWEENELNLHFDVSDLDLGIYYVFDSVSNDGYVLADLSSPAVPVLVGQILDTALAGNKQLPAAKEAINNLLAKNQKLVFQQSSLVALLDSYVSKLDPEHDSAIIETINQIHPMIEGDILGYAHANFAGLLTMILAKVELPLEPESIMATVQSMLPILNPTMVSYDDGDAYGIGLSVSNKSLKKALGVDLKELAGVSVDAGLALVFGTRNGLEDFPAPELIEVKANVSMEGLSVKASLRMDFAFNELSTFKGFSEEFKNGFTSNGMEFVMAIVDLFGGEE